MKPRSEQIRFFSSKTGETILDAYIEAAELGNRSLADLLSDIFDANTGQYRTDIFEFREDPLTAGQLQVRIGDFVDPNTGWQNITSTDFQAFVDAASTHATNAATSASTATTQATNAATSATTATTQATNASTSATTATTKASEAATSATNAATSASGASTSASAASTSATNAATSASSASTSATSATNSASAAAASASGASTSASNAATSASTATTQASNASTSATNAATSASGASTSATNAATSATAADTSRTAAQTAQAAAELAYDNFDDRYLGSKASDPTLDNDGNALLTGALYFNTATSRMMVYSGSAWAMVAIDPTNVAITGGTITGITDLAVADGGTGASNAADARTNLELVPGTHVQAHDAGLASIAGLTTAADKMVYTTGSDTYAVADLTAAGRAILDDADAAAQRTTLETVGYVSQSLTTAQQYQARTNIGAGFGFENRLINPLFQVDIEVNAGGVTASSKHIAEGWAMYHVNDVTTQTASRVAGSSVPYALRYVVTTGSDTSIAAGQYAMFTSAIEGYDIADAKWGTADAQSVWVCGRIKAPTTGTYCVSIRNVDATRSYVFEVSCIAGTWVDFEKEIPGDTSGTWDSTNGLGINLAFAVAMGATFQTTADTWATGQYMATANQANGLATNGNIYEIEDIRVSVGKPIKTEWRPYALDLLHCQRYYETSYEMGTAPGTNSVNGSLFHSLDVAQNYASVQGRYKAYKRITPTVTVYNPATGVSGQMSADAATVPANIQRVGQSGFAVTVANTSVGTSQYLAAHFVANARMI